MSKPEIDCRLDITTNQVEFNWPPLNRIDQKDIDAPGIQNDGAFAQQRDAAIDGDKIKISAHREALAAAVLHGADHVEIGARLDVAIPGRDQARPAEDMALGVRLENTCGLQK